MAKLHKRVVVLLITILVFALGGFQVHRYRISRNPAFLSLMAEEDLALRETFHYPNFSYTLADKFSVTFKGNWQAFSSESKANKCLKFFEFLDSADPDWELRKNLGNGYDKNIVRKLNFMSNEFKKLAQRRTNEGHPDPDKITREDQDNASRLFEEKLAKSMAMEQNMADSTTVLRIFGHCFYGKERLEMDDKLRDIYRRYNKKICPFADSDVAHFEVGNSLFTHNPSDPNFHNGDDVLDYSYRNLKGSGIVISAASRYSRDIVKFIHLLRALGNKLPIQLVYRSDLLAKARKSLMSAAYSTKEELLGEQLSSHKVLKQLFPNLDITTAEFKDREFPIQDITFINAHPAISGKSDFTHYSSKIIALFFSTFENVLLFDADTVPLVPPQTFLEMKEFTDTGAYFFRDRSLRDSNDWVETNFFSKLMPHNSSPLDMAMGVKPVTDHTMGNTYMTGWRHHQEAGLVVIDKKRHFSSLFGLFALALWGEPIKSLIWGDKEMYWLAMSIMGDEDYTFNKYSAASVGDVSEIQNKLYNNTKAVEVCSSHPGHVSKDGVLLWINSGFSFCKKNSFVRDQKHFPFSTFLREVLEKMYDEPLHIRLAVVPPDLPVLRPVTSPPDQTVELSTLLQFKKRRKDIDEQDELRQISTFNPQKGWIKQPGCLAYYYCAYDAVESYSRAGDLDTSGSLFTFTDQQRREYDFLGVIWSSGVKQVIDFKYPDLNLGTSSPVLHSKSQEPTKVSDANSKESDKKLKLYLNIFKSEEDEKGAEVNEDNTQLISLKGELLAGPETSDNKESNNQYKVRKGAKYEDEDNEFEKEKVRERPEHLKNNMNEFINKFFGLQPTASRLE